MKQILFAAILVTLITFCPIVKADEPPNVVLIMTDDQGLGDFGCMGNSKVQTPNIDQLFQSSTRFSRFYVCPVCSPTRASLLTGRYNYRTRVVDTFIGRSMMAPEEVTLAERFKRAGYVTGIFGKWHLGDCYPMRPHDRGFVESVVHRGGGIGQSTDPIGAEGKYTDPVLFHNGKAVQESGYCTDVYYDHAIDFIERQCRKSKPFFVYLPDNCPHGPFKDVPQKWWDLYKDQDLSREQLPSVEGGYPVAKRKKSDQTNRIFSMISNVDENVGRLMSKLNDLGVHENTIVIFMTDNGPNGERYTCGLRGRKTSVYEGGIRTLFLMHWPKKIGSQGTVSEMAAHIDVTPTLIEACSLPNLPNDPKLDGVSLMPLINKTPNQWKNRSHFFVQTHRGNTPVKYHHFAAIGERFKLVHHSGFGKESFEGEPNFELYDLQNDPYEKKNVIQEMPNEFRKLKRAYEDWFNDVSNTRTDNYTPPRIIVDPIHESPLVLARQDARRVKDSVRQDWPKTDHWRLTSKNPVNADVTFYFRKPVSGEVRCLINETTFTFRCQNSSQVTGKLKLPASDANLIAYLVLDSEERNQKFVPVHQVELKF